MLYVSLKRPQKATDTRLSEDEGILLRYKGKQLVGVTVNSRRCEIRTNTEKDSEREPHS